MNITDNYLKVFNTFIDTGILDLALILQPQKLNDSLKMSILDNLAYRFQIEFCKTAVLVANKYIPTGDIEFVGRDSIPFEVPLKYSGRSKYVFLVDIEFPYFEKKNCWEHSILQTLTYYKYPVFGFSSEEQIFKFYDNV